MRLKDFVKQVGGTTSDLFNLPLSALRPNPNNIRLDTQELRDHIRSIADSIKETGYLRSETFTVRFVNDQCEIVDGNCRYAACQIAVAEGVEILSVPCAPEAPGTTEAERTANQFVANSGLTHSPLEMTIGIKKMLSYGMTDTAIAKRLGKSRQHIANLLDLAGAAPDVQLAIANGTVSATQAIKLIRSEGADAGAIIAKVAEQARAEGKTRVTAKAFKAARPEKSAGTPHTIPPAVGLLGAAREVLRIWDAGSLDTDFDQAMECLRAVITPVGEMAA